MNPDLSRLIRKGDRVRHCDERIEGTVISEPRAENDGLLIWVTVLLDAGGETETTMGYWERISPDKLTP